MKKLFAMTLAVIMVLSMATVVSAENTTTLTTTVPAATYTLNIPADQEVAFGATETNIGSISVTDSAGFAIGKNLEVTLNYSAFTSPDVSTTIPFSIKLSDPSDNYANRVASGKSITFLGRADGTASEYVVHTSQNSGNSYNYTSTYLEITAENWGKALAGEYAATITFTAEVVAEE